MTPEERQLLSALADRVRSAPAQEIDQEADQAIRELVRTRPDTAYVLAQTVLMQDFALRNAQSQIADLTAQLETARQTPKSSGSFLGGLFGSGNAAPQPTSVPPVNPWGRPASPAYPVYPQPTSYAGFSPVVMQPTQTSGFLRSAATTAAGIAGGALLFEGLQSLFSNHAGYGGFGGGPGFGGFEPRESLSETTINNYYDRPPDSSDPQYAGGQSDPGFDQPDGGGVQDAVDYGGSDDMPSDPGGGGGDWT
jgi:hypothetical protein